MGEILGIGCTHAPMLQFPDENMADIVRRYMKNERMPAEMRDPGNWPAPMQEEWGNDEGLSAARRHRAELLKGFRAARAKLDEFKPDFIVIWGDDQYENFHEDLVPPFSVYAMNSIPTAPFKMSRVMLATRNVWNEPPDQIIDIPGHEQAGLFLVDQLINSGFDVACSFELHHAKTIGHAFIRTVLFLDYDRRGFPYPVVPFHVNCYGKDLWWNRHDGSQLPAPPAPPPWRCYDLGKQAAKILRASPWRVAVIGSSSWSHGFLTKKNYELYPDVEADRERFHELANGEFRKWRDLDPEQLRDSGQQEMLNWVCLAGAMEGLRPEVLAYSETYIFNSTKTVVAFPVAA